MANIANRGHRTQIESRYPSDTMTCCFLILIPSASHLRPQNSLWNRNPYHLVGNQSCDETDQSTQYPRKKVMYGLQLATRRTSDHTIFLCRARLRTHHGRFRKLTIEMLEDTHTSASFSSLPLIVGNQPHKAHETTAFTQLYFPGGGILFWWQLGAVRFLVESNILNDLSGITGASCGSFSAVLLACQVDASLAYLVVEEQVKRERLFERGPAALFGIWSGLIEEWLDKILPDNAHVLCNQHNVQIKICRVHFGIREMKVSDFVSKSDIIHACLASSHIPFFLDTKLLKRYRNMFALDGYLFGNKSVIRSVTSFVRPTRSRNAADLGIADENDHTNRLLTADSSEKQRLITIHHSLDSMLRQRLESDKRLGASLLIRNDQMEFIRDLMQLGYDWTRSELSRNNNDHGNSMGVTLDYYDR